MIIRTNITERQQECFPKLKGLNLGPARFFRRSFYAKA
jgi:hypothetical protein